MICPDCSYHCTYYDQMKSHYKTKHPTVKGYWKYFTKESRKKK